MPEEVDWGLTTHDGNRRRQHLEFLALSLREKLTRIEELGEVAAFFEARRAAREAAGGRKPSDHRDAQVGLTTRRQPK